MTGAQQVDLRPALELFRPERWSTRAHLAVRQATAPLGLVAGAGAHGSRVVEVGCGHGLLSLVMAMAPNGPEVLGVDIDADRIRTARRAAARAPGLAASFEVVDAGWRPPPADSVVLCDVLYLLDLSDQVGLVAAAAAAVSPGGRVVIKELDDRPRWKAAAARAQEQVAVRTVTHRVGRALAPPSAETACDMLRQAGLEVEVTRLHHGSMWPHYLAVGHRR